ncbi:tetratricopeptide repeat protein [Novipirellula rosea]|mgnify:CR=1 FL=1|uniref:tetratricopeptide repeat protein n=1 Tax=Novipirellula rosea TaxID=1031540 RepID=UPI0031EBDEE4
MAEKKADPTDANQSTVSRDKITTSLMVLAAAIAVLGFGTVFSIWFGNGPPDAIETLKIASREYIAGNAIIAGRLAQSVDLGEDLPEDDTSGKAATGDDENKDPLAEWRKLRQFLISAGEVVRARGTDEIRERREILIAAIPDFKAAVEKGLPVGREVEGKRLLAESYFSLGEFDRAAALFEELITLDPTLRRELLPLLAETLLRIREPKPEIALKTIEAILADKTLRPEQRFEANLIQVDALTRLGRYDEAEAAIERGRQAIAAADVTKQASYIGFQHRFKLAKGVVQIRKAIGRYGKQPVNPSDSREEVIAALAPTMMALLDLQREASPRIASEARIWAGRAYQCQGMPNQALSQWSATRQQRPFGGAAIISGLEEIEQLAALGLGVELVQTIRYMMREMGDLRGFDPTMVSLVEFRRRLIAALEKLRDQSAYQETIDVARSLPPIFTRSAALMQEGIAFREWAASTLRAGTQLNGEVSSAAASLARRRFRQAGDAFTQAAELDFDTTRYIKTQWAAIDSYQQGRHFERSIRLLRSYLRYEERQRQPRGLIAMGRALLAESEPVAAIEALETVIIEYPRDPLRYDARLLMALAYSETGDIEKARAYLIDNLQDGELTPQSPAWRDSLFTLAEILYQKSYKNHLLAEHADPPERAKLLQENQPILDAAIRRLDEAVLRYQPAPRADSAAYLAARSHILAAQWPRLEAQSTDILDAARRAMRTKVESELNAALAGFRDLKERILRREEEQKLTNDAQALLRNCMMAEADTLKEMGQLEEAATAYRTVSLRYMNQPPALEAILGQARCVRELGRRREADLLIRQASVVLKQIPPKLDDEFKRTTRYDRTGWEKMIAWMTAGMRDPGGGV